MTPLVLTILAVAVVLIAGAAAAYRVLRARSMERWIGPYLLTSKKRRAPEPRKPIHVLLAIADHYEPQHGHVDAARAAARVEAWVKEYPRLFARFRDSDGRPPRHTFFFPIDEYDAAHVDAIAGLCRAGFGEVEIHHHHDNDTADALRARLLQFKQLFRDRHGLLPSDRRTGEIKYGFVHGNWALDNSRPDGRRCGVNNELDVLRETGCYADFTMPSAPSPTQTPKLNSIYYAVDDPLRPRSADRGTDVGTGPRPDRSLLLVQGPLLLNWRGAGGGLRPLPRVENGNLQSSQHPTLERLDLWLRARVQVPSRPDWFFVKLYTHGATERNQDVVLAEPMVRFHEAMARRGAADASFRYHYVTAREMYNLVRAAEANWTGDVNSARDFELVWDPGTPLAAAGRDAGTPADLQASVR